MLSRAISFPFCNQIHEKFKSYSFLQKRVFLKNKREEENKQKAKEHIKQLVKNKQDLIKNNYLSSKTNHLICINITQLGAHGELFVDIDIDARLIITHCFKSGPLDLTDIIDTLGMAIKHFFFLPKIQIIHFYFFFQKK